MKKLVCLICALFLLLTVVSVPAALAMGIDYTGEWLCTYLDLGDGVLLTEYQGMNLQEDIKMQLNADSSFSLISQGMEQVGTWQPTGGGIAMIVDSDVIAFSYEDDMLLNTEDGVTMYFSRAPKTTSIGLNTLLNLAPKNDTPAFDFTGTWDCVSYEAGGMVFDIKSFFPDGITLRLQEDGAGFVQLTPEYAEPISWALADDGITLDGSNFLYNPVWDAEAATLTMHYAADMVNVSFVKLGEETDVAPPPASAPPATALPATALPATAPPAPALPQTYECAYFTASFPETWKQDEFNTYEWDTYYSVQYDLEDDNNWSISSVRIEVSTEKVDDYRSGIKQLEEYAVAAGNDTLDEITIDGIALRGTTYGDYWVYTEYLARVPEASITIHVTITGPENIEDVLTDVLNSISFTYPIPDPPLMDPPMPEDGVPYQPSPAAVNVGGYDLQAQWLTTEASLIPKDEFKNSMAVLDNTVYILASDMLYAFDRSTTALTAAGEPMDLEDDYRLLSSTLDGPLYITDSYYSGASYQDGAFETFDMDGYLVMHPDGVWGLCWYSSSNVKKITLTSDGMATKDWILTDLSDDEARQGRFSSVEYIQITSDHIFVAGSDASTEYAVRIAMYDLDGNELAVFGSDDWTDDSAFGSVTGIVETDNGIIVQDGYNYDYKLFALDGTFLGLAKSDVLLGTKKPKPVILTATENGALALVVQKREDGSAIELLVFEITGF